MNNSIQSHNFAKSVESIIEKTELNIRLNNQLADNVNGAIYNKNGETTIEINPNSDRAGEFVLMHELTHAIGNQDLKQTILDYANKNKEFESSLEDLNAKYGQNDVTDEVMADISGQLLGNEEFINTLATEQPGRFKQIYNAVKSWVKKFTGTYGYEDFVKDVEAKWQKAFEQSKNNITENIGNNTFLSKNSQSIDIENTQKKSYNIINKSISNSEKKQVSSEVLTWRANQEDGIGYIDLSDGGYKSYIYNKHGNNVETLLKVNGSEEFKNYIRKGIEDGTYKKSENIDGWATNAKSQYRNNSNDNDVLPDGRVSQAIGSIHDRIDGQERNNNRTETTRQDSRNKSINQESENNSGSFNLPKKQQQLDIINKSNPMQDDYHTGIRSVDDIKTLEETLQDSDWSDYDEFNPDLTRQDLEKAIETGKVTIYSSYPIEQGTFVSPSRMEAESYSSGDGKIYSKEVNISDIAWIDPTQGQYAKTDNLDTRYSKRSDKWQNFLDKNFQSRGTTNQLSDMKQILPTKENSKMVLEAKMQEITPNTTKETSVPLRTTEQIANDKNISDLEALKEESEQVNIPSKKIAEQVEKELASKEIEKSPTIDFIKEKRSKSNLPAKRRLF